MATNVQPATSERPNADLHELRFPDRHQRPDQDQETCEIQINGKWERVRFHDYDKVYRIPGFYESLFYRTLKCCSPQKVVGLLHDVMVDQDADPSKLRVFDFGAGNGMVGEELRRLDIGYLVGADIIEEAEMATNRDRPWVYNDYYTVDMTAPPESVEKRIRDSKLNALTAVAALGYGDVPADAFLRSLDLIEEPGWLAFNIKEDFLKENDETGFAGLIRRLARKDIIQIQAYHRYRHRLSIDQQPLHYVAMVATKEQSVPDHMLEEIT